MIKDKKLQARYKLPLGRNWGLFGPIHFERVTADFCVYRAGATFLRSSQKSSIVNIPTAGVVSICVLPKSCTNQYFDRRAMGQTTNVKGDTQLQIHRDFCSPPQLYGTLLASLSQTLFSPTAGSCFKQLKKKTLKTHCILPASSKEQTDTVRD